MENKEVSDALHMLLHCALQDKEYTTQKGQFHIVNNYIKELENENEKKNKRLNRQFKLLQKLESNSIPKSVIKEKIEELEKAKGKYGDTPRLYTAYDTYDFQTNILKELLE